MEKTLAAGKTIKQWKAIYPLMELIIDTKEVFWTNPDYKSIDEVLENIQLNEDDVKDAEERLERFAPYIAKVFPDTKKNNGLIESPIVRISNMKRYMMNLYNQEILGNVLLKCDSHLAISGSIKARGGIYEILKHAEALAIAHGMLKEEDDYSIIDSDEFRKLYSQYSIAVGSTGNLGLSIGIMGAKLGFKVTVHMSADAKQWKKDLLVSKGVNVVEYDSDYSKAVEEGRNQSNTDPNSYFVDDENSKDLFLGYAVAASRLKRQLDELNIIVDKEHPLFVYLPCGVGGAPGGITFGLKLIYKDHVYCFFAEPTHSPCMLIGCMTQQYDRVCVQDFGIDNITSADGLAVGKASGFVSKTIGNLMSGIFTVDDNKLFLLLKALADTEKIFLEPSALAGVVGPIKIFKNKKGQEYLNDNLLIENMKNGTHIAWATGGSMVPKNIMDKYYNAHSMI